MSRLVTRAIETTAARAAGAWGWVAFAWWVGVEADPVSAVGTGACAVGGGVVFMGRTPFWR
ncbi:hypothetical protein, partial [Nocardiopsis sp. B62]|uniref:hypothetical protein n=1 Tax=Nocardiopsis sp. B62 TaxID=2824874 RepID=UPI001B391C62